MREEGGGAFQARQMEGICVRWEEVIERIRDVETSFPTAKRFNNAEAGIASLTLYSRL